MSGSCPFAMRRRFAPALMLLLACALSAKGEDLLDAVLNTLSAAQTNRVSAVSAGTADSGAPSANGGSLLDAVLNAPAPSASAKTVSAVSTSEADLDATSTLESSDALVTQDAPEATSATVSPVVSPTQSTGPERAPESLRENVSPPQSARSAKRSSGGKPTASGDHIKNPATFSIRGGGGDGNSGGSLEYRRPLGNSAFDWSIRGFIIEIEQEGSGSYTESYYTYWYSWWSGMHRYRHYRTVYYYWDETQRDIGVESFLLWVPFRGRTLEPFAGVGIRYESVHGSYYSSSRYNWDEYSTDDSSACFVGRLGLKLNLGRLFLTGEYIVGSKVGDFDGTSELIGDIGIYLTRRMQLHVFAESVKIDLGSGTAFGGGLSFDF